MRVSLPGHSRGSGKRRRWNREEGARQQDQASERLQFLAGLETYSLAGGNADFLARAGITSDASLTRANIEHAKTAQLNAFSLAKRAFHGFEDGLDSLFRLCAGHAGLVDYRVHYVELNHTSLRFPQRQAMLVTQLRVVKLDALG